MYYYQYEAYFLFGDISLRLEPSYFQMASLLMWFTAILTFGLLVFSAIANKRGRVLGCLAAIAAPFGAYGANQVVSNFAMLDFGFFNYKATSTVSLEDAINKLSTRISEEFVERILFSPYFIWGIIWSVVIAFATLIILVYSIVAIKSRRGKILALFAMIIAIVRFILIAPVQPFSIIAGFFKIDILEYSTALQLLWIALFFLAWALPALLLAFQALICLVNRAKDALLDAKAMADAEALANIIANAKASQSENAGAPEEPQS